MRKPYPKVLLSNEDFDILEKVAHKSKIDTWFELRDRKDKTTDKCYTAVFDLDQGRFVSLQYGVRLLSEGCSPLSSMADDCQMTKEEVNQFQSACFRLGILCEDLKPSAPEGQE